MSGIQSSPPRATQTFWWGLRTTRLSGPNRKPAASHPRPEHQPAVRWRIIMVSGAGIFLPGGKPIWPAGLDQRSGQLIHPFGSTVHLHPDGRPSGWPGSTRPFLAGLPTTGPPYWRCLLRRQAWNKHATSVLAGTDNVRTSHGGAVIVSTTPHRPATIPLVVSWIHQPSHRPAVVAGAGLLRPRRMVGLRNSVPSRRWVRLVGLGGAQIGLDSSLTCGAQQKDATVPPANGWTRTPTHQPTSGSQPGCRTIHAHLGRRLEQHTSTVSPLLRCLAMSGQAPSGLILTRVCTSARLRQILRPVNPAACHGWDRIRQLSGPNPNHTGVGNDC